VALIPQNLGNLLNNNRMRSGRFGVRQRKFNDVHLVLKGNFFKPGHSIPPWLSPWKHSAKGGGIQGRRGDRGGAVGIKELTD
jgi:hypothetical protein